MSTFVYPATSISTTGLATEAKQDTIITEIQALLEEATYTARVGEVSATPTANTVLARLKDISDALTDVSTQTTLAALLTELQAKADLTETQPVSQASQPLPTGAATETTLSSLLTELQAKADLTETQPVSQASQPLPTGAATETTLSSLLTELQAKADLTETQPVSQASQPLPTGAATETTLSALNTKVTACDTGSVTISAALPTGSNTIGSVNVNAITPVDFLDSGVLDSSSSNILTTGTSVVASLAAACTEIEVVDDIGEYMTLRDGVGTVLAYLPLGGGRVKVSIPATTNVELYSETGSSITVGKIAINFLG